MTRLMTLTAAIVVALAAPATAHERIVVAVGPVPINLDHPRPSLTIRPNAIAGSIDNSRTNRPRACGDPVCDR